MKQQEWNLKNHDFSWHNDPLYRQEKENSFKGINAISNEDINWANRINMYEYGYMYFGLV